VEDAKGVGRAMADLRLNSLSDDDMASTIRDETRRRNQWLTKEKPGCDEVYWGWTEIALRREQKREAEKQILRPAAKPKRIVRRRSAQHA
jgi:hypothetical protein